MASDSGWLPMRHPILYDQGRSCPKSPAQYQQQHPSLSFLAQPPMVHVNPYLRSHLLPPQRTEANRVQSSVSSGESNSSASTDDKYYLQSEPYQYSAQAKRGSMNESAVKESHYDSHVGNGIRRDDPECPEMTEERSTVFRYIREEQVEEDKEHDHALWILIWMSVLDPAHCLLSALYTIFAVLTITLSLPYRLCRREYSPGISLVRMVAPLLRHHLQMIHARSLGHAHTFEFSPICLVLIHLVSPILSIPNAIAAWVVAVFWIFAIIMGNPDGTEKRDDGRAAVLMLRDWWERCLLYAIRK